MSIVKKINILSIRITWVLRHRWEKGKGLTNYEVWDMRKRYKLGIWFNVDKVVGPVKRGKNRDETVKDTFTNSNLVNSYVVGVNLIVCKTWITVKFKPTLGLKL